MAATRPQPVAPWTADGTDKRTAVRDMFGEIAPTYDLCNSLMSLRRHRAWRALAVRALGVSPGDRVADVCCGTGDFFAPLRKAVGPNGTVVGVDFCLPMLALAGKKDILAGRALGDACALPLRSGSVQAVSVGWGIRNVPDIDVAHREIHRVLKPGGVFVSLDMAIPRGRVLRALSRFATLGLLPKLGALFGKREAYTYLPKSTQTFMTREQLKDSMERAGFRDVTFRDLFFGNVCLHRGVKP